MKGLPEKFRCSLDNGQLDSFIQETTFKDGQVSFEWVKVRPIPEGEDWFENIWNDYSKGTIFD